MNRPIKAPANVSFHPRYKPAEAISLISPPPKAPFIRRDTTSIGTDIHTNPISLDINPGTVNPSTAINWITPRTAIRITARSGTMPSLISAHAQATSNNRNNAVNTPTAENPSTKNAQNKATAAKM